MTWKTTQKFSYRTNHTVLSNGGVEDKVNFIILIGMKLVQNHNNKILKYVLLTTLLDFYHSK